MGYRYEDLRESLFTDDGQRMFLAIRDRAKMLLREAGAFRLDNVIEKQTGDSWMMLACVDRLVELGEIVECQHPNNRVFQNRIFTNGGWRP